MTISVTERQAQIALERATYTGEPTARMRRAAELIKGATKGGYKNPEAKAEHEAGNLVAAAMLEAGYGRLYVEGSAKTFPGVLVNAGLLDETKAEDLTPEPEPVKPVKHTKEKETIQ